MSLLAGIYRSAVREDCISEAIIYVVCNEMVRFCILIKQIKFRKFYIIDNMKVCAAC